MTTYLYGNGPECLENLSPTTSIVTTAGTFEPTHVPTSINVTSGSESGNRQLTKPFSALLDEAWYHAMYRYGSGNSAGDNVLSIINNSGQTIFRIASSSSNVWSFLYWDGATMQTLAGSGIATSAALQPLDVFFRSGVSGLVEVYRNQVLIFTATADFSACGDAERMALGFNRSGAADAWWSELIVSDEPTIYKFLKVKNLTRDGDLTGFTVGGYAKIRGPIPSTAQFIYSDTAAQSVTFSTATVATGTLATTAIQALISLSLIPAAIATPITARGLGTVANGVGNVTPGLPAATAADDICLLYCETNTGEAVTAPTGWTAVGSSPQNAADTRLSVFYRRMVGGDVAPTITDPGDHCVARIVGFVGCKTSGSPIRDTQGTTAATATAIAFPVVETQAGDMFVGFVSSGTDTTTSQFSAFAGTELTSTGSASNWVADGGGGGIGVGYGVVSAALAGDYDIDVVGIAFGYQRSGSSAPPDLIPLLREGATNYDGATYHPSFGWLYSMVSFTQDPATSADWTVDKASSSLLQPGFRSA